MDLTTFSPDAPLLVGAIVVVAILLAVWYFYRREQAKKPHHPFGVDHTQAIIEMGMRTRAEAERKEREMHAGGEPRAAR